MKFAQIEYSDKDGNIVVNGFNSIFYPFKSEKINILGAEGYRINLSISKNADRQSLKRALAGTERFLAENGVTAVCGESFNGLYLSEGRTVMALLALSMVKGRDEIVVIGGDTNLTETVLCALCPYVSYISLLTDEGYRYAKSIQLLFDEYGINVQVINSIRHANFRNADVMISCGARKENYDYMLKNGSLYYDLTNDKKRQRHIKRIRADVRIVASAVIRDGRQSISPQLAECALYASVDSFRRLAAGGLNCAEKLAAIENIGLSPLTSNKR